MKRLLKRALKKLVLVAFKPIYCVVNKLIRELDSLSPSNDLVLLNNIMNSKMILEEINEQLKNKGECICIFAPMFGEVKNEDGYIQRIRVIDDEILSSYHRIYLYDDKKKNQELTIKRINKKHTYIVYNCYNEEHRDFIFELVRVTGKLYIHSIYRLMDCAIKNWLCKLLLMDNVYKIWDVHGSVPEECLLYGEQKRADIANSLEKIVYQRMNVAVVVTTAMRQHLLEKYGKSSIELVSLPIFNEKILKVVDCDIDKKYLDGELPKIVYAGGLNRWQNIGLMLQVIEKTMRDYQYKIFVPLGHSMESLKEWQAKKKIVNITIDSKTPSDLMYEYRYCHYGFALREDIVVNNVACPTKIVEYLKYGIVPILKTNKIGDFASLGMQYIPYEKLLSKELPSGNERLMMARHNYKVLKKIEDIYTQGKRALEKHLEQSVYKMRMVQDA